MGWIAAQGRNDGATNPEALQTLVLWLFGFVVGVIMGKQLHKHTTIKLHN
jgi:hypothetical protein